MNNRLSLTPLCDWIGRAKNIESVSVADNSVYFSYQKTTTVHVIPNHDSRAILIFVRRKGKGERMSKHYSIEGARRKLLFLLVPNDRPRPPHPKPCRCKAYPFPHRLGSGRCHSDATGPYCGECGSSCDWTETDRGVGPYDYGSIHAIHTDWRIESDCCEAPVFADAELRVAFEPQRDFA